MPTIPGFHDVLNGQYVLHKTLGSGGFAKVKLATHVLTGEKVAVKIMCKDSLGEDLARIRLEIEALKVLNHQNICKLYQIIETDSMIYLVLEYCSGGELFDYIIQKERLEENEARIFFRQIVSAVAYVHSKGYAHRDLKPENLLLHVDNSIKLIDFGLCAKPKVGMEDYIETCCGSPAYAAPELLSGTGYNGSMVDVWSLGVLLYALLCGYLPFDDENVTRLYRKIQRGKYSCPSWLSTESKLILADMLQVDPARRIPIGALMLHPWIVKSVYSTVKMDSLYENEPFNSDCLSELAVYYGKSKKAIEVEIRQNKYDYMTATYLLLRKKQKEGKLPRLLCPKTTVLKESRHCNRNLAPQFNSKPVETRLSFDNLDDVDLLTMGSPNKNFGSVRSPVYSNKKQEELDLDKENFLVPLAMSPNRNAKKKTTNENNGLSGLSNSMDLEVTKTPVAPFLSVPLHNDKRTKSLDSPLSTQHLTVTPPRRRAWESGSLSAKKVLGSIEKSLDKVKNMITPNKRLYSCGVSTPRNVKSLCNVSATNEKVTPDELLDSLQHALFQKGILCKQNGYTLLGKIRDAAGRVLLKFELEVCRLPRHQVVGVRRKRLVGDAWHYKRVCEEVLKLALLVPERA